MSQRYYKVNLCHIGHAERLNRSLVQLGGRCELLLSAALALAEPLAVTVAVAAWLVRALADADAEPLARAANTAAAPAASSWRTHLPSRPRYSPSRSTRLARPPRASRRRA